MFKARAVRSTKLEKPRPLRSLSQTSQPTSPTSPTLDNTSSIQTSLSDLASQIDSNNPVKLDDVKGQVELLKAKLYENQQSLEQVMQLCNTLQNRNTDSQDYTHHLLSSNLSNEIRHQLESSTVDNKANDNSNVPTSSDTFRKPNIPVIKPALNGVVATPKTGGNRVTMRTPYTNLRRSLSEPDAVINHSTMRSMGSAGALRQLSVNEQRETPLEEEIVPLRKDINDNLNINNNMDENQNMFVYSTNEMTSDEKKRDYVTDDISPVASVEKPLYSPLTNDMRSDEKKRDYVTDDISPVASVEKPLYSPLTNGMMSDEKKRDYVTDDISSVEKPLYSPLTNEMTDDEPNERGFPYTNDIKSPDDKSCCSPFRYEFTRDEQKDVEYVKVNGVIESENSKPRFTSFKEKCEEIKKQFIQSSMSLQSSSCESEKSEVSLFEQQDRDFFVNRFHCMKKEIAANPALFTKSSIQYTIVDLVALSVSPLSNTSPKGWSYLAETFPAICLLNQTWHFKAEDYEGLDEDTYSLLPDQQISGLSMKSQHTGGFPFNPRVAPPGYTNVQNF